MLDTIARSSRLSRPVSLAVSLVASLRGSLIVSLLASLVVSLVVSLGLGACSDDMSPPAGDLCLAALPAECAPLYVASSYDEVLEKTLIPSCSVGGGACHAPQGAKGGLIFDAQNPDQSWSALVDGDGGPPRVVAGDAECSPLVHRLLSTEPGVQMPPGKALSEAERCAVVQWIRAGAPR